MVFGDARSPAGWLGFLFIPTVSRLFHDDDVFHVGRARDSHDGLEFFKFLALHGATLPQRLQLVQVGVVLAWRPWPMPSFPLFRCSWCSWCAVCGCVHGCFLSGMLAIWIRRMLPLVGCGGSIRHVQFEDSGRTAWRGCPAFFLSMFPWRYAVDDRGVAAATFL